MTAASGVVQNVYPGPDGAAVTTPLAGWTVFDDGNRNGVRDRGEAMAVTRLDGSYTLSLSPGAHDVRLAQKPGWGTPAGYFSSVPITTSTDSPAVGVAPLTTAMTNPVVIDVAAFTADSNLPWGSLIPGYVRQANQVFANSDTNVRLNLVSVRPASYAAAGNLSVDLARLSNPQDGYMDAVPAQRDQLGADIVILFDPTYTATAAGLAYIPDVARPDSSYGSAVCCYSGDATFDGYTVAHEVGHTLGADHDADHGPNSGSPAYARGARFVGNDGVLYHDVMAYPPGTTLPFFSSPNVFYAGHALGDAGTADNVRVIRQTAAAVAGYRASRSDVPKVAAGPAPVQAGPVRAVAVSVAKGHVSAGGRVWATAVVRNKSGKRYSGKVAVEFYLSGDRVLDAGDTLLRRARLRAHGMKAHGKARTSVPIRVTRKNGAGVYYVLAVAKTTGKGADEGVGHTSSDKLRVVAGKVPRRNLI
jgi:hypothetical protein